MILLLGIFIFVLLWCVIGLIGFLLLTLVFPAPPYSVRDFQMALEMGPVTFLLLLALISRRKIAPALFEWLERRIEKKLDRS